MSQWIDIVCADTCIGVSWIAGFHLNLNTYAYVLMHTLRPTTACFRVEVVMPWYLVLAIAGSQINEKTGNKDRPNSWPLDQSVGLSQTKYIRRHAWPPPSHSWNCEDVYKNDEKSLIISPDQFLPPPPAFQISMLSQWRNGKLAILRGRGWLCFFCGGLIIFFGDGQFPVAGDTISPLNTTYPFPYCLIVVVYIINLKFVCVISENSRSTLV